jgi:hypothetical protein
MLLDRYFQANEAVLARHAIVRVRFEAMLTVFRTFGRGYPGYGGLRQA